MKPQRNILVLLLSLLLLTSCVSVDGTPLSELTMPAPLAETEAVETEAVAAVEFPLLPLSEGEALRASEVFNLVSPAVAYVETPLATGSGILIGQGYLVSNAHVVWPYNSVRVAFPDGTEFQDVEVIGWDLMADLALLALPESDAFDVTPLNFVDGSALTMGSDIYLIGYPGEVERFPQPTISQGILSRVRRWETTGMEVFQVDADTTGGQSGGVMVTERGEVIGITTFEFTSASYAMVPSAAYAVPRLNALANQDDAGFSDRRPLGMESATEQVGQLEDPFDTDIYILEVDAGEEVELTVEGVGHPYILVSMVNFGWDFYESEEVDDNVQNVEFTTEREAGPYLVAVKQQSTYRNDYTLSSSHPLAFYADDDDYRELTTSDVITAALDVPGEIDLFKLELQQGEKVAIEVDSLLLTPLLTMIYESPTHFELVQSFEGGATSVFGENARIVLETSEDATYSLIVDSAVGGEVGGYFITASMADADEEVTEALESHDYLLSSYGPLDRYESRRHDFALNFPASFRIPEECPAEVTACYVANAEAEFYILEEDLDLFDLDDSEKTQEAYVDFIEELLLANFQGGKIESREPITTPQGIVGTKVVLSAQAGLVMASRFIYVNEDSVAFNATYFSSAQVYDELEEMLDYTYTTFREWDEDTLEDDPVYHFDEGLRLSGEQEYDAAIEALTRAIELNPEFAGAYSARASVYGAMDEDDLSIADYEQAVALEPEDAEFVHGLGFAYWDKGDLDLALEYVDQSIDLDPESMDYYNIRALIHATAGNYDAALADMEEIAELEDNGKLAPYFLDSRAYIYLKMEEYDTAKQNYDDVLAEDFKSPYVLFGAGITYARLGMMEEAIPLLEYGMKLYAPFAGVHPGPQMRDLLRMTAEYIDIEY